jgi:WhiB family redox-sensing transcriptional regulator
MTATAWPPRTGPDLSDLTAYLADKYDDVEDGELAWQDRARCAEVDGDVFFPEKGGTSRDAKKVCRGCEVRPECLEYALRNDERYGVFGGLSERERRGLKRKAT